MDINSNDKTNYDFLKINDIIEYNILCEEYHYLREKIIISDIDTIINLINLLHKNNTINPNENKYTNIDKLKALKYINKNISTKKINDNTENNIA